MQYLGIEIPVKNAPVLDPEFIPMGLFNKAFLKTATKPVSVAVEREEGQIATATSGLAMTPLSITIYTYFDGLRLF